MGVDGMIDGGDNVTDTRKSVLLEQDWESEFTQHKLTKSSQIRNCNQLETVDGMKE